MRFFRITVFVCFALLGLATTAFAQYDTGTAFSVDDQIMGSCTFVGRKASCLISPTLPVQLPAA